MRALKQGRLSVDSLNDERVGPLPDRGKVLLNRGPVRRNMTNDSERNTPGRRSERPLELEDGAGEILAEGSELSCEGSLGGGDAEEEDHRALGPGNGDGRQLLDGEELIAEDARPGGHASG